MQDQIKAQITDQARETVTLVIPLYNEVEVLPILIEALEGFRKSRPAITAIQFINDGSTDQTETLVHQLTQNLSGYKLINFSRNFGHQLAVTAGLTCVKTDAAIILDADLQDPLEVIDQMTEKWHEGYDVVYGVRQNRDGESWFKQKTAAWFYRIFRMMTDLEMPVDTGDFRLLSANVIAAYQQITEQQPFVRGLISWLGFNQIGVTYDRKSRAAGETKYPFKKMMRLALNSLTAFSQKPLRFAVRFGLATAVLSILGLFWVLAVKYIFDTAITGWASLIFVGFFFGGIQLFFLGIIGTYLGRVYEEVKGRPRYIIQSSWQSDE